jgi:hypothetical protein
MMKNNRYAAGYDETNGTSKGALCIWDRKKNQPRLFMTNIRFGRLVLWILGILGIKTLVEK